MSRTITWLVLVAVTPAIALACGGSSSGESPPALQPLVDDYCALMGSLECVSAQAKAECQPQIGAMKTKAEAKGCENELAKFLQCALASNPKCVSSTDVESDPNACDDAARNAFYDCVEPSTEPDCSMGVGPSDGGAVSCKVICSDFGAECTGATTTGSFDCVCQGGKSPGSQFTISGCSSGGLSAVQAKCQ